MILHIHSHFAKFTHFNLLFLFCYKSSFFTLLTFPLRNVNITSNNHLHQHLTIDTMRVMLSPALRNQQTLNHLYTPVTFHIGWGMCRWRLLPAPGPTLHRGGRILPYHWQLPCQTMATLSLPNPLHFH